MKRSTPLKRGKPLRRGSALRRTGKLKAKGKSRFPKRRDPVYCAWVRAQMCIVVQAVERNGAHVFTNAAQRYKDFPWCGGRDCVMHIVGRGRGGDDRANIVPACWKHNDWQTVHMPAVQFGELLELDLVTEAHALDAEYELGSSRPGDRTREDP
jgi:hypothetical protein